MRSSVAVAAVWLLVVGLSTADETQASIKKRTDIPAEGLGAALQTLAKDRNFQVVYVSEEVNSLRTHGAVGEFTPEEALRQLLKGTGMTFHYLDERTVTITPGPIDTSAAATASPIARADQGSSATTAVAQDPSSARNGSPLEEIVVTARRREESLQQVPIAISAFDQDTLQRHNVGTLTDLQQLVPSAYVTSYAHGSSQQFITLRGQGESGLNTGGGAGGGPAVVGYLSEVPVPISGPGLYYDLQSVEVLEGPQGTLFGRNTTGGAVLFEPHRPDLRTVQGYGQLLGGDYARGEVQAAINVPVVEDKLAVRVAGQIGSREGYTRDADTGVGYDNRHFRAARIGILFHPNEVLENYVIGNYVAFNEHGPGASLIAANPANPFLGAGILDYVAAQQARGIRATALDVAELDQGIFYTLINKTSLALNDTLKLRNILSYSRQRIRRQDDEDGIVLPLLDSLGSNPGTWLVDQETVTEELQLQGNALAQALNWQTGVYYEDDRTPNPANRTYTQQVALLPFFNNTESTDIGGTTVGAYAQGSYKLAWLLEGLSFTAGYRHTWDHLREGYSQAFDASRTPAIGDFCTSLQGALYPNCLVAASARHGGSSYTIGLDWQADPGTLLYIVSRQGYKSGGFNIVAATVGDTNNPAFAYRPEIVRDLEVGLKADWLLGTVKGRTNLAVYNSWYRDAQVNTSALIDNLQEAVTANAARATIRGVEIENTIEPNAFSDLSLSYSFMDAHYNRYVTPLGQDLTGLPYAYAPRNKASVTARVRLPVADLIGEIWIGADVSYQDRVFAGFSTVDPGSYLPSYGLLGLRGDWQNIGSTRIDLSVFATNVTNRAYRIANEDLYSTIGTATTVYGEPRMYGASLRYRF